MAATPRVADAQWDEAERERAFWRKHQEEYRRAYSGRFVAVKDGEFVAARAGLPELAEALEKRGMQLRGLWVRHFSEPRPRLL